MNPIIGRECTSCPFPCAICDSATQCTKCADLYYLDDESKTCKLFGMDPNCFVCDHK